MEDELLFFGIFCQDRGIPINKRKVYTLKEKSFTDERIKEYVDLALDYAKRTHCDLFVYENDMRIKLCLYLKYGVFVGRNKKDLAYFIEKADDCFIFKDEDSDIFEMRLCITAS